MPLAEVKEIRNGAPSLRDLPGQLRQLALALETDPDLALVEGISCMLTFEDKHRPRFYGWGYVEDRYTLAGLFMHCAQLVLTDKMAEDE